jgi:putative membrane protein
MGERWLDWRRLGYALDEDRLLVRSGWWRRRRLILPLARIQSIDLRQSFISRWFGVGTLAFGVAGGGALSIHRIPALPIETARQLRSELLTVRA